MSSILTENKYLLAGQQIPVEIQPVNSIPIMPKQS